MENTHHIASLTLDESSVFARMPEHEHERQVAITDLVDWNHFALPGSEGPYDVVLGTADNRITMKINARELLTPQFLNLPLAPFRTLIRDYFLICESYREAMKTGNMARIEAIDMSRRGLHNEGSRLVQSLMSGKADMDFETARRLFTLICVLHIK
jgi:uncharacterized protein (UPF0262 family)